MKYIVITFFVLLSSAFVTVPQEKRFDQDVVVIHGIDSGLPDGQIDKVFLKDDIPLIQAQKQFFCVTIKFRMSLFFKESDKTD